MPDHVLIATILPERGHTGVQSHFNALRGHVRESGTPTNVSVVSAYAHRRWLMWPTFVLRRPLERLSRPRSVWWYDWSHYVALRAALRQRLISAGPVCIYAQCPLSALAALDARTGPDQRVHMVVHFNVSQAEEWVDKGLLRPGDAVYRHIKAREAFVLPRLDGIVYVSRFMQDTLRHSLPAVGHIRSIVVPNFVARPVCATGERPASNALISVGSLEPRKNQAFLLHVLAEARDQGTPYELTLVGDGQDRRSLEALAQALGIRDQVEFTGFRPDVSRLFAAHRAYVQSSRIENMPVAPIEAMAHGLPVFAAPVGGVGEVFTDGQEGRYWSLDDPTDAARILSATLADARVYRRMSSAARRRYAEQFAPEVVGRRLVDFLLEDREERATRPLPQSALSRRSG